MLEIDRTETDQTKTHMETDTQNRLIGLDKSKILERVVEINNFGNFFGNTWGRNQ